MIVAGVALVLAHPGIAASQLAEEATSQITVEQEEQLISLACMDGLKPLRARMSKPNPRLTTAQREDFLANFEVRREEYCVCVVNGVPIRNLRPGETDYVQFLLRHAIEPGMDETKRLMVAKGLDENRMAAVTYRYVQWTRECRFLEN